MYSLPQTKSGSEHKQELQHSGELANPRKRWNTDFTILSNGYAIVYRCILGTLGTFKDKGTKTDKQEMVL